MREVGERDVADALAQSTGARTLGRVGEVALLFGKLGLISFGGPAAHIALMHEETVVRRGWLSEQQFLDLLSATNLIPGPNATEMAIHIGYVRAGWPGLLAGGASFIAPAMLIVGALAWAYARYGSTPQVGWLLYGIKPVVIAVVAKALWELGRKAVSDVLTALVGAAVFALYFLGVNELALLFGGGLLVMLVRNLRRVPRGASLGLLLPLTASWLPSLAVRSFSLPLMFLIFLKVGSVLYGSGYVLLAFLRADLVERLGWLTDRQLLDAIAVGQVTPGPVLTTATFIGYILGGPLGALLATVGIFLPSFVFVALSNPLVPRLRESPWASGLLDGVGVASLGLMAAVTVLLGRASFVDWPTVGLGALALALLWRLRLNPTWLVLGGAVAGLARMIIQGGV